MPNPNYKPSITIKKKNLTITPKTPPNTDFNSLYLLQGRLAQAQNNMGKNPYQTS